MSVFYQGHSAPNGSGLMVQIHGYHPHHSCLHYPANPMKLSFQLTFLFTHLILEWTWPLQSLGLKPWARWVGRGGRLRSSAAVVKEWCGSICRQGRFSGGRCGAKQRARASASCFAYADISSLTEAVCSWAMQTATVTPLPEADANPGICHALLSDLLKAGT